MENFMKTTEKSKYRPVDQSDPDRTRDEYLEEENKINKKHEEFSKTNLFKSRIIDTEINSSLIFQSVLYFHFYYTIMCYLIQTFSASFKLWIFIIDNILVTKLVLPVFYLIFQMIRISIGYKANLQEKFPDFIFFKIFTVVFIFPCQVMQVVGIVLPIDYATVIIEVLFLITEIILSIRAMIKVTRQQGAVYYLRNTQTNIINKDQIIKTSLEIEEELFYNFPNLKKNVDKLQINSSIHQKSN